VRNSAQDSALTQSSRHRGYDQLGGDAFPRGRPGFPRGTRSRMWIEWAPGQLHRAQSSPCSVATAAKSVDCRSRQHAQAHNPGRLCPADPAKSSARGRPAGPVQRSRCGVPPLGFSGDLENASREALERKLGTDSLCLNLRVAMFRSVLRWRRVARPLSSCSRLLELKIFLPTPYPSLPSALPNFILLWQKLWLEREKRKSPTVAKYAACAPN